MPKRDINLLRLSWTISGWVTADEKGTLYLVSVLDVYPIYSLLVASLPTSSTKPSEEPTSTLQSHCYIKMREKSNVGTRRWKRKWSVLRGGTILFYRSIDEDRIENQHLAKSIELRDKQAIVFAASTHNFTFALQDINLQQIVLWLRYDTEEDFQKYVCMS
jgi:hypothetical protein